MMVRTWGRVSKCYSRVVVIRTCGHFSKSTSRVVVIRNSGSLRLAAERGDLAGNVHWARTRPAAKSLPADGEGTAGKRDWGLLWSNATKIPSCQCGIINAQTLKD